jgi:peptidoglycan hydrolase CwlO-like protein
MPTVTENDLREIKDLIAAQSAQIANIQNQFTDFQTQITDLKISVGKIEATLQTQQIYF